MPTDLDEHAGQMTADRRILGTRVLLDDGAQARPHILHHVTQLRTGEKIPLQLLGAAPILLR